MDLQTEEGRFLDAIRGAIDDLRPLLGESWPQFEEMLRRFEHVLASRDFIRARFWMDRLLDLGLAGEGQDLIRRLLKRARTPETEANVPVPRITGSIDTRRFDPSIANGPQSRAAPQPASPAVGARPEFQIKLKGDQVHGGAVMAHTEIELVLFVGAKDGDSFALKGKKLDQALTSGAELGVFIVPVGYRLVGEDCYRKASIASGIMDREIVFRLEAGPVKNRNAGAWVYLDLDKSSAYAFFLSIPVIEEPSEAVAPMGARPLLNLDAKGVPIDARLCITQEAGDLIVSYCNMASNFSRQKTLKKLTLSTLTPTLKTVQGLVQATATSQIWRQIPNPFAFSATDSQKRALADAMRRVAQGGWELWVRLGQDEDLVPILRDLDGLPPGSRITIVTDCAFVPWEIVYPENIVLWDDTADAARHPVKPMLFWGARYIIQSTLPEESDIAAEKLVHSSAASGALLCLNPSIDDKFEEVGEKPSASHRRWADELRKATGLVIEPLDPQSAVQTLLRTRQASKYIYVFCHGRGGEAEAIELGDGVDYVVRPADLHGTAPFEGRPIVFLNSCSSGAYEPLSLTNFYQEFRDPKRVLGLIGTSFPVPAMTAASIGQRVMQEYLLGKADIGNILYDARKQLVENSVPIGLFYTLHCPADARAIGQA